MKLSKSTFFIYLTLAALSIPKVFVKIKQGVSQTTSIYSKS